MTEPLRQATVQVAKAAGQDIRYWPSSSLDKEEWARTLARERGVRAGLVASFSAVEPCRSYPLHRNRERKTLDLELGPSKGLHDYHYDLHPHLGLLNIRVPTGFPFTLHVGLNGREWLARQMDAAGIGDKRMENGFVDLADPRRAQELMEDQLRTDGPKRLDERATLANPVHEARFPTVQVPYYWSVQESGDPQVTAVASAKSAKAA